MIVLACGIALSVAHERGARQNYLSSSVGQVLPCVSNCILAELFLNSIAYLNSEGISACAAGLGWAGQWAGPLGPWPGLLTWPPGLGPWPLVSSWPPQDLALDCHRFCSQEVLDEHGQGGQQSKLLTPTLPHIPSTPHLRFESKSQFQLLACSHASVIL